jgi:hypothetical protein
MLTTMIMTFALFTERKLFHRPTHEKPLHGPP